MASYNAGNYNACNRMTSDGYREDYPKEEEAKKALRAVLRVLDADVLGLQEIGARPYLEELRRDLRGEGLDYPYALLVEESEDKERHLALLSRLPLLRAVPHSRLEAKVEKGKQPVKRGVLEAVVATPRGPLSLWLLHLKSRYTEEADDPLSAKRRAAEAVAIRDLILRRHPDPASDLFLIAGDFNDSKTNRPLRAIQERGKTSISELLEAADSRGERWTYHNSKDDSYDRIDHLLGSPGLVKALGVMPRAVILDGAAVEGASDHRPVYVDLCFAPRPSSP